MKKSIAIIAFLLLFTVNSFAASNCIFGVSYGDSLESDQFTSTKIGDRMVRSRLSGDDDANILHVKEVRLVYKATDLAYRMYYTFEDEFDGGNKLGWIEDEANGKVVAEISDGEIYKCKLFDNQSEPKDLAPIKKKFRSLVDVVGTAGDEYQFLMATDEVSVNSNYNIPSHLDAAVKDLVNFYADGRTVVIDSEGFSFKRVNKKSKVLQALGLKDYAAFFCYAYKGLDGDGDEIPGFLKKCRRKTHALLNSVFKNADSVYMMTTHFNSWGDEKAVFLYAFSGEKGNEGKYVRFFFDLYHEI